MDFITNGRQFFLLMVLKQTLHNLEYMLYNIFLFCDLNSFITKIVHKCFKFKLIAAVISGYYIMCIRSFKDNLPSS